MVKGSEMSKWDKVILAAGALLLTGLAGEACAADVALPPDESDWVFTGAAYLWGAGINGEAGLFGFPPQDVNLSLADVVEKLDGAVMVAGQLRNGAFSVGVDVAYVNLSDNVTTPFGIAARDVDISTKTFMGTAVLGYSVIDSGTANLDLVAGGRLWSASTDFDFNGGLLNGTHAGDEATWLDPVVGAKFSAEITDRAYLAGWGLVGGFGVGSDMMWDVMGGIGYNITDSFSLFGGYRALSVDYSHDGFVYYVVQQGPVIAGAFRF